MAALSQQLANKSYGADILLLAPDPTSLQLLKPIFARHQWSFQLLNSLEDLESYLQNHYAAVLLSPGETNAFSWRHVVNLLKQFLFAPKLIVYTRFSQTGIWPEIIASGGFDVLAEPFNESEVRQVISFAWLQWRRAWEGSVVVGRLFKKVAG